MFRRSGLSPKDTILKQIKVRNKEQDQKPSQKGAGWGTKDNRKKNHAYAPLAGVNMITR